MLYTECQFVNLIVGANFEQEAKKCEKLARSSFERFCPEHQLQIINEELGATISRLDGISRVLPQLTSLRTELPRSAEYLDDRLFEAERARKKLFDLLTWIHNNINTVVE